jgi:hypothetical protein
VRDRQDVGMTAGYSGTPLPRKLGIRDRSRVLLVSPPSSLGLDPLPLGAVVHRRAGREPYDVIVAFCPDARTLHARFAALAGSLTVAGALWACWPKKASGVPTDLTENLVREHGLQAGLVDVKVAAVDATWSGLKFVRRLADR